MSPRFGGAPKCPRCEKSVYMAEQVLGPGGQWHNWCLTCKECNKRLDSTTLTEKDNEAFCKTCYTRKWGPKGYGFAGGAAFLSTENKMPSEILEENDLSSSTSSPRQFNVSSPPPRQIMPTPPPQPETTPTLPARQINTPTLPPRQPNLPPRPQPTAQESSKPGIPTRTNVVSPPPVNHHDEEKEQNMSSFWSNNNNKPKTTSGYISHQTSYVPRKFNFQSQNDICTGCGKAVYAAELVLGAGNKYHKLCLKCCQCGKRLDSTNMVDKDFDLYCRGCYSKAFGPKGYGYGNLLTPEGATR